jgi:hypothetical protein
MGRRGRRWAAVAAALGLAAALLPGLVSVWVDEHGHVYLTDRPEPPPGAQRRLDPEELALVWNGQARGEPLERGSSSVADADRYLASVLAARSDILRGELDRGLRALRRLWRESPGRPEAGYLLALVERHRGRLEAAHATLQAVLATPAELPPAWLETATRLRAELDQEIALAQGGQDWEQRRLVTDNFRISYDHQFAGRAYGEHVAQVLERVRAHMLAELGLALARPLEVKLYTRGHYLQRYEHRFGFATVGFYDGTIHVVSARHPRDELFALLVHEYGHALFLEALGSHQPFFLNEGICDREEERVRGRRQLSRGEWRQLLEALREQRWIPFESLVRGFSGLSGERALLAYLESRAAVELIESRRRGAIGRWLSRARDGEPWERALSAETGWDMAGLQRALQDEVLSRFVADPLASGSLGAPLRAAQASGAQ